MWGRHWVQQLCRCGRVCRVGIGPSWHSEAQQLDAACGIVEFMQGSQGGPIRQTQQLDTVSQS